jgi:hypothetical protein
MSVENSFRIFLIALGFWGALYGPWWLPYVPIVLLSLRFRAWEAIVLGLVTDFLYAPSLHVPMYLILSIVIVWVFEPLRSELLLA